MYRLSPLELDEVKRQVVMDRMFRLYIDRFIVCYLEDIVVYSKMREEHPEHLKLVLEVFRREHLFAKHAKCLLLGTASGRVLGPHCVSHWHQDEPTEGSCGS
ncbi:hypothetical protein Vretifemale_20939 [Volvox reticuliferus]|uniref:Reverse transcriptase domain-containing protein n=1 Tax=Volvox reticuliferus TaxID=1737510 RepID=A0A8J4D231_9CHLO|nr:hypothetical protein Vretifemale_20939 [Volvox reticuliferus]